MKNNVTATLPANVETFHRIDKAKVGASPHEIKLLEKMRVEVDKGFGPSLKLLEGIENRALWVRCIPAPE